MKTLKRFQKVEFAIVIVIIAVVLFLIFFFQIRDGWSGTKDNPSVTYDAAAAIFVGDD